MPKPITVTFKVPGKPIPQPRPRVTVRGGHGHGYVPIDHPIHAYRAAVLSAYNRTTQLRTYSVPMRVAIVAMMPRPSIMTWKRRPMPSFWHVNRPDSENIAKGILDALTGHAWDDDSCVCDLSILKRTCAGGELPYTQITITVLED